MGTVVGTGLAEAGIKGAFFERYNSVPVFHPDICTTLTSSTRVERYRWLGSVPQMRPWTDSRLAKGLRSESYDVESQKYEATIDVDREEIEDDQLGGITIRVNELADAARMHPDVLCETALIAGGDETSLCFDGAPFFSDAHESGSSGAQSNDLAPDMAGSEPTTDEFKLSIRQAIAAMMSFKDDRGAAVRVQPSGLVLAVPPQLFFVALEAVNSTIATALRNVLESVGRIVVMPGLTSAATWYLLKVDAAIRPLVHQVRTQVEFASVTSSSDARVFTTDRYLYGVRARWAVAYGMWCYAVRNVFTQAG